MGMKNNNSESSSSSNNNKINKKNRPLTQIPAFISFPLDMQTFPIIFDFYRSVHSRILLSFGKMVGPFYRSTLFAQANQLAWLKAYTHAIKSAAAYTVLHRVPEWKFAKHRFSLIKTELNGIEKRERETCVCNTDDCLFVSYGEWKKAENFVMNEWMNEWKSSGRAFLKCLKERTVYIHSIRFDSMHIQISPPHTSVSPSTTTEHELFC